MPLKQAQCRNLEYSWFSRDVRKKIKITTFNFLPLSCKNHF